MDSERHERQEPRERLRQWMRANRYSQKLFGAEIDVHQTTVGAWLRGERTIPAEDALRIERFTGGELHRADLRPDLFADLVAA